MLRTLVSAFLLATAAFAQTAPVPARPAPKKPARPAALGPDTPVMYVTGLCALRGAGVPAKPAPAPAGSAQCVRAVTKAQFEGMIANMGPRAANADKAQLAEYYMRALLIDNEVRKLGLDQDPMVAQALWMNRIGVIGDALHRHFQKKFANVPEAEIAAYYEQHKDEFDEVTVRRVVVPKPPQTGKLHKPSDSDASATAPDSPSAAKSAQAPAAPEVPYEQLLAARKAYSEKLLARARAGEDFDKLQKEAFTLAKIEGAAPDTNPVPLRRGQLPETHDEKVFAAQAGEYTALIEEPNAFLFYKVEKRRIVPLDEARDEVRAQLVNQKEEEAIKRIFTSGKPTLNPAYFAPPAEPAPPPTAPEPKPEATPQPPAEPKPAEPKSEAPPQEEPKAAEPKPEAPAAAPQAEPPKQESEPPKAEAPAEPPK